MTTFDKREAAEEGRFALDAEMQFKARARRNRLVGQWAAEKLGLSGTDLDGYAAELVVIDLQEQGDGDVIAKLKSDFAAHGLEISDQQIELVLNEKMTEVVADIKARG